MRTLKIALALVLVSFSIMAAAKELPDPTRDILVTFDNDSAPTASAGLGPPYSRRKSYTVARQVRHDAADIARIYSLETIEHWPIRSLSVYCFVFRVPEGTDRQSIIDSLSFDVRVESAQPLQSFETGMTKATNYDDTYANLQYGLDVLGIAAAHRTTRGAGVRIAIVDSNVDQNHEDLLGRIGQVREFLIKGQSVDRNHGTAVASVIGARTNNALGIVGIAPEATLESFVSCWSGGAGKPAVCDSFSLSKALDAVLEDPPQVLNLSLNGPHDPLLERLIQRALDSGVIVVAAVSSESDQRAGFPSSLQHVIGVGTTPTDGPSSDSPGNGLFAPGTGILVATPKNQYEFRSGSSLAAAHVSGVVALLLSIAPESSPDSISAILHRSQISESGSRISINACDALNLVGSSQHCGD
ncbi:MAG TPA: S8 family serine peptidase [Woeseiaceae bacterium]|nr:S8 family serine peptidase [Woeseiaceae bacterium]